MYEIRSPKGEVLDRVEDSYVVYRKMKVAPVGTTVWMDGVLLRTVISSGGSLPRGNPRAKVGISVSPNWGA